jgi:hypothetical protein
MKRRRFAYLEGRPDPSGKRILVTPRLTSTVSVRARRRSLGVLAVVLAVLGALFSVGAADACACGGPPTVPLNVVASQTNTGEVTITWDAPASAGDSAITHYVAGWNGTDAGFGEELAADAASDTLTGLTPGTYTFWVFAKNDQGDGPRAEVSLTVAGADPTLKVSRTSQTAGGTVELSGIWEAGQQLSLERALPGHAWSSIAVFTVNDSKLYSRTLEVSRTASYRMRSTGDRLSAARKVTVQNLVKLAASRKAFRTYRLSGKVYPAVEGQTVRLYVARNGGYASLKTVHTTETGYFRYKHRYAATDTFTFKAVSHSTPRNAPGRRVIEVAVH